MSILENELVKKYFGCATAHYRDMKTFKLSPCYCLANHVLAAMETEIEKGDRLLTLGEIWEKNIWSGNTTLGFHPYHLRLPDRFQAKECVCDYASCPNHQKNPNLTEEMIDEQVSFIIKHYGKIGIEGSLRELIRLARGGK